MCTKEYTGVLRSDYFSCSKLFLVYSFYSIFMASPQYIKMTG